MTSNWKYINEINAIILGKETGEWRVCFGCNKRWLALTVSSIMTCYVCRMEKEEDVTG